MTHPVIIPIAETNEPIGDCTAILTVPRRARGNLHATALSRSGPRQGWNVGEEEFRATLTFARFAPPIFRLTFALLVTLAVVIWGIVWMTRQGEAGPSRYGPDPRTPEETHPAGGVPT